MSFDDVLDVSGAESDVLSSRFFARHDLAVSSACASPLSAFVSPSSTSPLRCGTRPFRWRNDVNSRSPLTFLYTEKHLRHPTVIVSDDGAADIPCASSCHCRPHCRPEHCPCAMRYPSRYVRDNIVANHSGSSDTYIAECNGGCGCGAECFNRAVQRRPINPRLREHVSVYMTAHTGWGLRCAVGISSGEYIAEYVGELVSDLQAENRLLQDSYLWSEALHTALADWCVPDSVEPFAVDARQFGNVARFVNHSCEPNAVAYQILTRSTSPYTPTVAFFATKHIPANTEITVNYHYEHAQRKPFDLAVCKCEHCRGNDAGISSGSISISSSSGNGS